MRVRSRRWLGTLLTLAGATAVSLPMHAGRVASASAGASATVLAPAGITTAADLRFGKFVPGSGGSVTVGVDGDRTGSGSVVLSPGQSGSAAEFNVVGDIGDTFAITLPSVLTIPHQGNPRSVVTIDDFVWRVVAPDTKDAGQGQTVRIGGTLNISGSQTPGAYVSTLAVGVEHN